MNNWCTHRKVFVFSFLIATFFLYLVFYEDYLSIYNQWKFPSTTDDAARENKSLLQNSTKKPLIVSSNDMFGIPTLKVLMDMHDRVNPKTGKPAKISNAHSIAGCNYQCEYSDDYSRWPNASAVVFHIPGYNLGGPVALPPPSPDRLHVFFTLEVPAHSDPNTYRRMPANYFNLTMTYRPDSDIFYPYNMFEPIDDATKTDELWTDQQVDAIIAKKSKPVFFVTSDCHTPSKREEYVAALGKHIPITQYGACNGATCANDTNKQDNRLVSEDCFDRELAAHYFYLAIENSICNGYMSEKFWNIKSGIVPIVLSRRALKGLVEAGKIPGDSFIAADDFASPKLLAEHLIAVTKDKAQYKRYFEWAKHYKNTRGPELSPLCELCKMVHLNTKLTLANATKFWDDQSACAMDYGRQLLKGTNTTQK